MLFIHYYVKLSDFCEAIESRRTAIQSSVNSIPGDRDRSRLEQVHDLQRAQVKRERDLELDRAMYHLTRWLS